MVYYDRQWGCSMSKCHEPCVHADVITESSDCSLFTISYFLFIVFFSSKMHKRVLQSHIYYLDRFDMPFHIVFAWPSSLLVFLKMDTDILCCLLFRFGESRWCSGRFLWTCAFSWPRIFSAHSNNANIHTAARRVHASRNFCFCSHDIDRPTDSTREFGMGLATCHRQQKTTSLKVIEFPLAMQLRHGRAITNEWDLQNTDCN